MITLPVLGINTQFDTNNGDVFAAIEESFGGWRLLDPSRIDAIEPLRVRIDVTRAEPTGAAVGPVRHVCPDAFRVMVVSPECIGTSDPERREATAFVDPALVADRSYFRETVLEALTFALLSHFDRHPIHAAGVASGGRAVLLAGPSGAGKSTLAHAAHDAGLAVLHDDHVWIQQTPTIRVWGSPGFARVGPAPHDDAAARTVPKDQKTLIELPGARTNPAAYVADGAVVCVLEHGSAAAVQRIGADDIREALTRKVDPGFDRFPGRHGQVVDALAAGGGWRLTVSVDPREAVPLLAAMADVR